MSKSSERTPLSAVLAEMQPFDGGFRVGISDDWRQGRAIYGGLSTALCLTAARGSIEGLPPLRSAQVSFIGPAVSARFAFRPRQVSILIYH